MGWSKQQWYERFIAAVRQGRPEDARAGSLFQNEPLDNPLTGGTVFGRIRPGVPGAPPGNIRLLVGRHLADHSGYSAVHMEAEHARDGRLAEYNGSAEDFVADVGASFTSIYRLDGGRLLLVKSNGNNKLLVVEARRELDGDYSVVTGYIRPAGRGLPREKVWERSGPASSGPGKASPASEPAPTVTTQGEAGSRSGSQTINNIARNRNRFKINPPPTLFQADPPAPTFYSQLRRILEQKMPNRAIPQMLRGLISKAQIKADELRWTGFDDWLAQQTGPVTKEQVLAFLDANAVQIHEVELGRPRPPLDWTRRGVSWMAEGDRYVIERLANGKYLLTLPDGTRLTRDTLAEAQEIAEAKGNATDGDRITTHYDLFQLPGPKREYRELLLTLPEAVDSQRSAVGSEGGLEAAYWPGPENRRRGNEGDL